MGIESSKKNAKEEKEEEEFGDSRRRFRYTTLVTLGVCLERHGCGHVPGLVRSVGLYFVEATKVCIVGGYLKDEDRYVDTAFVYDWMQGSYERLSNMHVDRSCAGIAVDLEGRNIYVCGGYRNDNDSGSWYKLDECEVFSVDTRLWSKLPTMPCACEAAAFLKGKLYCFYPGEDASMAVYNPRMRSWTEIDNTLDFEIEIMTSAVCNSTRVGFFHPHEMPIEFDAVAGTWEELKKLPTPEGNGKFPDDDFQITSIGVLGTYFVLYETGTSGNLRVCYVLGLRHERELHTPTLIRATISPLVCRVH